MKKVIIRAPLLSASGYGVHSRQIFRWLLNKNVDVRTQIVPWGMTSWYINEKLEDGLIGEVMNRSIAVDASMNSDLSIQIQLPNEWDPNLAQKNIGVSAFVETDRCNPEWLTCCNRMDHVVVPSQHVLEIIQRTGSVSTPVSVISESFFDDIARDDLEPLDISIDTSFNFLMVGQITGNDHASDRKNLFGTLKWLCEAFSSDPDVGIILKTNSGRGTSGDRAVTEKAVKDLLSQVRKGPYPAVHLLHGNLTTEEMARLYRRDDVKAFVSLTRGEGFGLPLLEAAASDIPVIATNWSGHLDFLNRGRFLPVNYTLKQIPSTRADGKIFIQGTHWAEPIESDFKKKVAKFRKKSEIPTEWARDLGNTIRSEFSQAAIEKQYDEELGHFLK